MNKLFKKGMITLFVLLFVLIEPASAMIRISDRISLSWPGTGVNHTITFLTVENIPAGGRIDIIPEDGEFFIFGGFDYSDVDLATSSAPDGPFIDRNIASSTSSTTDAAVAIASTSSGSISIVMNDSYGITSGVYVEIELGTNASYGGVGDRQIINSSSTGSYNFDIKSYDASGQLLKKARPMIVILEPVTASSNIGKRRLYGAPIGWLSYGTTQTIMSLVTNFQGRCRYSTASNTSFSLMTEEFDYSGAGTTQYHTKILTGLINGGDYDYYVRCRDADSLFDDTTDCVYTASTSPYTTGTSTPITSLDCVDYWIPFNISGQAGDDSGDEAGDDEVGDGDDGDVDSDSGGSGGSGGGSGGGRGNEVGRSRGTKLPYPPLPGMPGVIFEGWSYPGVDVRVLKDGTDMGYAETNASAEFGAFLEELTQGVYTFVLYSEDKFGRRSSNYSTTFWIDDGTQTTVSDIIISPTIAISKANIDKGENLEVFGASVPNSQIEVWLYPRQDTEVKEENVIKTIGIVDGLGSWTLMLDTDNLSDISYSLKARTKLEGIETSGFSQIVNFIVGPGEEVVGECSGADLNQDGKVNITDFSILLYHWGTNNACADQNHNGTVDLIDFSIMMYFWTG